MQSERIEIQKLVTERDREEEKNQMLVRLREKQFRDNDEDSIDFFRFRKLTRSDEESKVSMSRREA